VASDRQQQRWRRRDALLKFVMSDLSRFHRCRMNRRRCVTVCIVLFASTVAFGSGTCGTLDRTANAIHLAELLYPELKGKEFSLQFSEGRTGPLTGPTDAHFLVISVDKAMLRPPQITSEHSDNVSEDASEPELPLHLQFDFVRTNFDKAGNRIGTELTCQPWGFLNANGSKQIHDAWAVINAHPEWTNDKDLEAARRLGMQFGPEKKVELLRILPLKELSSIYGPLEITDADFKVAGLKEPETSFALLHWQITAKRLGSEKKLLITVEPFQGKIISISG
jgi:hypothetical protein